MSNAKNIWTAMKTQRLESQKEEQNLRVARLGVSYLIFPTSAARIMAGVVVVLYAINCFYLPSSHGRLFDGFTRFLLLIIVIGCRYLACYQAKVVALRKLISKESPALYEKLKNTAAA